MRRFRCVYGWPMVIGRRGPKILACLVLVLFSTGAPVRGAEPSHIRSVSISRPFFNPTVGQKIGINVEVDRAGSIGILILDRDGYPVRRLVAEQPIQMGRVGYEWNGRNDAGEIVPDEAYSLKIDFVGEGWKSTYFPATAPSTEVRVEIRGYDRRGGILSYKLAAPARVHAQAGVSWVNEATKKPEGPVMKTIANREPRPAGAVVENWDGFDETGVAYLPDLPHFAVAVAASALPENSLIVAGNESLRFVDAVAKRSGASLLPAAAGAHGHHKGLGTLDDVAPSLRLAPSNARWSAESKTWTVSDARISGSASLEGPSAANFGRQPGQLEIYVDSRQVETVRSPKDGMAFSVPLEGLSAGSHLVVFNWSSDYGPVAVSSIRVERAAPKQAASNDAVEGRARP